MKLITLIENHKILEKAEIEIQMIPGIPQIHFLGLPDQAIKESFLRIKSALKVCGFKFPMTNQIIVNIKPNYLKKSSKGLELAVALGILHMTGQKILSESILESIIYGELSLNGDVTEPSDLFQFKNKFIDESILSGISIKSATNLNFRISNLNQDIEIQNNQDKIIFADRPQLGLKLNYTTDEAEILFLFSVEKIHLLLSGPAGSGKSTMATHSICFTKDIKKTEWPLLLAPHNSVTSAAFLGGGSQLYQGEIEKVQNGILFLDEFLEFNSDIIEALRGPMTGQKLRLSRAGNVREFDCDFQVIASTNLCPCGKWTPEIKLRNCRFSNRKCRADLEKLSGPILDRFGIYFYYNQKNQTRDVCGEHILKRIHNYEYLKSNIILTSSNSHGLFTDESADQLIHQIYPDIAARRKTALKKIALVYAIERESSTIELKDLIKAEKWTYSSFLELEKGMS